MIKNNQKENSHLVILRDILSGSVAGIGGKLIEHPFDTIKVRLQTQSMLSVQKPFSGPFECFQKTFQYEGIRGLYQVNHCSLFEGLSSPLIGAMIENAVLFFAFKQIETSLKNYLYSDQTSSRLNFYQFLLAGALSGACGSLVLTPVELIKCRVQVDQVQKGLYKKDAPPSNLNRVTPLSVCRQIIKENGFFGFYKGFSWTLIREMGGTACWFGTFESLRHTIQDHKQRDWNTIETMASGAIAGFVYNLSFFPADVLKSIVQTTNQRQSIGKIISKIWKRDGIRGFYRGLSITLLKAIPSNAIIFLFYEKTSTYLNQFIL